MTDAAHSEKNPQQGNYQQIHACMINGFDIGNKTIGLTKYKKNKYDGSQNEQAAQAQLQFAVAKHEYAYKPQNNKSCIINTVEGYRCCLCECIVLKNLNVGDGKNLHVAALCGSAQRKCIKCSTGENKEQKIDGLDTLNHE